MPALMRYRFVLVLGLLAMLTVLGACGREIGDGCTQSTDCDPNGERICDPASVGGYCTIQGCDVSTCPGDSACIRFFTGSFSNKECDHDPENPADPSQPARLCSLDELCALNDHCVARSSEVRFCMRECGSNDDCRGDENDDGVSDYECRDLELMKAHGGEPVLDTGAVVDERSPKFCAAAPP
jgi:hypothetical protein